MAFEKSVKVRTEINKEIDLMFDVRVDDRTRQWLKAASKVLRGFRWHLHVRVLSVSLSKTNAGGG